MAKYFIDGELSNEAYHKTAKGYSSSQIKDMLEGEEYFYRKHVTKELERDSSPSFDTGSYFHCAILEPHKLDTEFTSFDGRKAGKAWEEFQIVHEGKTILNQTQLGEAINLINATKKNVEMMGLLAEGRPELSFFSNVFGLDVKVRTDWIHLSKEKSYIMDLKSSTGNVKNAHKVKSSIENYHYDLSAALYVLAVNEVIKNTKLPYALVENFYWGFASKDVGNSQVWVASEKMMKVGLAKLKTAIGKIQECEKNKWVFKDTILGIDPVGWATDEWIEKEIPVKQIRKVKTITQEINLESDV